MHHVGNPVTAVSIGSTSSQHLSFFFFFFLFDLSLLQK